MPRRIPFFRTGSTVDKVQVEQGGHDKSTFCADKQLVCAIPLAVLVQPHCRVLVDVSAVRQRAAIPVVFVEDRPSNDAECADIGMFESSRIGFA